MMDCMEALVRTFDDVLWNSWNDDVVEDLLTEGFTFRGSLGAHTHGPAARRSYRDSVREGAPDFHNEVVALVVDGDQAAARLLYTGTHRGRLAGLSPSGRRFSYAGAAFFTAEQGRLSSAWVLGDLVALREQLG